MSVVLSYRGMDVTKQGIAELRALIAELPGASRRALSLEVCRLWGLNQANGVSRDAVCRGMLLALHRAGHLELPPARWVSRQPSRRLKPRLLEIPQEPLETSLAQLGPLQMRQVRRTTEEPLVCSMLEQHHYLGYTSPVGEHLKYLITAQGRPIGCFCWSSAPRHLGPRDRHIGWSIAERKQNLRFVAYQTRFLILPWVRVPHLASHLLGRMSRQLSADWEQVYAHPIYFTETFVDTERGVGTCYRAANWLELGLTTGLGKASVSKEPDRSLKRLYGYPLVSNYRRRLCRASG